MKYMKKISIIMVYVSSMLMIGCSSVVKNGNDTQTVSDKFWSAMKGDFQSAKEFLKSDVAKKSAVAFFKIAWQTGLTADSLAGDDPSDLAKNFIHPFCNTIKSMTSVNASVSIEQISAVASAFGNKTDLSKYGQITGFYAPIFEWVTSACGDDAKLAIFYLNAITDAGEQVTAKYL